MTRIEAGAIRLKLEQCDVQDLVGCALAALEQRIGNREVVIQDAAGSCRWSPWIWC